MYVFLNKVGLKVITLNCATGHMRKRYAQV
jgi:hypothetical protein